MDRSHDLATTEVSIAWIHCGGKVQEAGRKGEGTKEGDVLAYWRKEGKSRKCESAGADTKANARAAAHLSEVTTLPLSPSHSLVMPAVV